MSIAYDLTAQPTVRRVTINPAQAEALLSRNEHNRRFSENESRFKSLCRALENGEWKFNGDAIRIDKNGRLIDGQHRLRAVIKTGVTIDTLIVEGLEPESQQTIDTGKARSVADFLSMRHVKNAALVAAIVLRRMMADRRGLEGIFSLNRNAFTIIEQLAYFDQHKELEEFGIRAQHTRTKTGLAGALIGTLMIEFEKKSKEDSDYFWEKLGTGAGLDEGHPILTLRNKLRAIKDEQNTSVKSQRYVAALIIKGWNKYRAGEVSYRIDFRAGGANPEKFPEAI